MTGNESPTKTLSLQLPQELDMRIGAIAGQRGSSKTELVRNALVAYLAGEATPDPDRRWILQVT